MRGKVSVRVCVCCNYRITPAYAGKRSKLHLRGNFPEDHPRLCGEKVDSTFSLLIVRGSPPPMRGKVSNGELFPNRQRITPAYAGKSHTELFHSMETRDHPRLCGEKF